jgi:hypothetical protein
MLGCSQVAAELAVSQEGLSSMKLVTSYEEKESVAYFMVLPQHLSVQTAQNNKNMNTDYQFLEDITLTSYI